MGVIALLSTTCVGFSGSGALATSGGAGLAVALIGIADSETTVSSTDLSFFFI